jgi:hypothetical protein
MKRTKSQNEHAQDWSVRASADMLIISRLHLLTRHRSSDNRAD